MPKMDAVPENETAQKPATSLLSIIGSELKAAVRIASDLPRRAWQPRMHVDQQSPHATPIVFVHGLMGDPSNFTVLRRALHERGARTWSSFAYLPRLDIARLAPQLLETIVRTRQASGSERVDVVGHSLGGVLSRFVIQSGHGRLIRRLVTLGAPYMPHANPRQELAIFASHDALVPAPQTDGRLRPRMRVIENCGHIGLLSHPGVIRDVVAYLTRPEVLGGRLAAAA
jgi:pimeloyl-ACP methyl ester carboxylesterase